MILAIIVTYNGERYIEDCIRSLLAQTVKTDIVVVDNASSDSTCEIISSKYPEVAIINIGYNSGFAHANNIGMQYAIDNSYDYVMLINEDTICDNRLMENMLKHANSEIAVIPKIYMDGRRERVWYAAGKIDFERRIAINCQDEFIDQLTEVTFMTGCCMLLHTDILRRIGFFDEAFFMYYEDTDFSLRMYENGIKMMYTPETYVWHRMQGRKQKGYYFYYMERNKMLFLNKHRKVFHCSIIKIVLNEFKNIIFKPDVYTITFLKFKLQGMIDFIRNRTGMMTSKWL